MKQYQQNCLAWSDLVALAPPIPLSTRVEDRVDFGLAIPAVVYGVILQYCLKEYAIYLFIPFCLLDLNEGGLMGCQLVLALGEL